MSNILEDLYDQQIDQEKLDPPQSKEYHTFYDEHERLEEEIIKVLGEHNEHLLEEYQTTEFQIYDIDLKATFAAGFRLGAQIILECLRD